MIRGVIGIKRGMSGIFTADGKYIPVTVVEVDPCVVTQIKRKATDGYDALQIGSGAAEAKRFTKPLQGHFRKAGGNCYRTLKEFSVTDPDSYQVGQSVSIELFKIGERVEVSGKSKGRGYSGVIKRHGFHGGKDTHGSHSHRVPGSIGCSAWPAKVIKGKKLPGQYGNDRKTIRNLEIVDIRDGDNLILLKGAVPGSTNAVVEIKKALYEK